MALAWQPWYAMRMTKVRLHSCCVQCPDEILERGKLIKFETWD